MSVTQKQIAQRLGFSQSLVARALKGYPHIAEETQEKVLLAAREMGYHLHSNGEARALVARRHQRRFDSGSTAISPRRGEDHSISSGATSKEITGLIGLMGTAFTPRDHRESYWAHLVEGIQSVLSREERRVLLLDSDSEFGWDKVDGVLTMKRNAEALPQWVSPTLPCVSLLNAVPDVTSVVADDRAGGRQATNYLLELGHRRIACLVEEGAAIPALRLAGYRDALQVAGIEEKPDWVLEFPMIPTAKGYVDWGHSAMTSWLREGWLELGCTALLAQNDGTAIGAIQALREANVIVPQQVSVVGFDGTETFDYFSPQLTSVEIPLRQIGVVGTEALLASIWGRQVANEDTAVETIMLLTRIKEGQSAAPSPTLEMAR